MPVIYKNEQTGTRRVQEIRVAENRQTDFCNECLPTE